MKQLIAVVVVLFLILLLSLPSGPPTRPADPQLLEQAIDHKHTQAWSSLLGGVFGW